MAEITKADIEEIKSKALEYYKKHKIIQSPCFGEIRITNAGFNHIEWKDKSHLREFSDAHTRYICFFHTAHILENMHLYQEYREEMKELTITKKRQWQTKKILMKDIVRHFGFIAVVNKNKHRVRIVVSKKDGCKNYEFVSVVPAWKRRGYLWSQTNDLFFDEPHD